MLCNAVKRYFDSSTKKPFFLFVSDREYRNVINELTVMDVSFIRMSDFCSGDDKFPSIDSLFTQINIARRDIKRKKVIIIGLGEYLAIRGQHVAWSELLRFKDLNVSHAKVVLLLRGLATQIEKLNSDPRFDELRYCVIDSADCNLSITYTTTPIGLSEIIGFKSILRNFEKGCSDNIIVNTSIDLRSSLFNVKVINDAYEGVKLVTRDFSIQKPCGEDKDWAALLKDLNSLNGEIEAVFKERKITENMESEFYNNIVGNDYRSWLYYIYLKYKTDSVQNSYLRHVINNTNNFKDIISNVLNFINKISITEKIFPTFYLERKKIIERFPESDIAGFVVSNRKNIEESIYRLTDVTKTEREEILAWISQHEIIPEIKDIYPSLNLYLKKYIFKCPDLSDLLTHYFDDYKKQKILNRIEDNFLTTVEHLACQARVYNRLPTRNQIIDQIDKTDAYLYWIDALGVEYLSLIESLVEKKGLSIHVSIARADLPTITSMNRDFYDNWNGRKEKNNDLDEIKHKASGGYNFIDNELPIHLVKEIDVISRIIDSAATKLKSKQCKLFIIASDHGASRLAVLNRKEEKYETDTKGEHSGRCCKINNPDYNYNLKYAAEENGYLVLADYGRFKGSRAANVEVHGGASLEEVIVPIIELELKEDNIIVELIDDTITVDYREGAEVKLFFNYPVSNVLIMFKEKSYMATQYIDKHHFFVKLPDVKRAGDYEIDVYVGDNYIDHLIVKMQGRSGRVNEDFDELF